MCKLLLSFQYIVTLLCTLFLVSASHMHRATGAETDRLIFLPSLSKPFPFHISALQPVWRPLWIPGSDIPRNESTFVATITNMSNTSAYSATLDVEVLAVGDYYTKTVTPALPLIAPGVAVPVVVPVDNYRYYAQNLRVMAAQEQPPTSYQVIPVILDTISCQDHDIGIITGTVHNTSAVTLTATDIVVWRNKAPMHTAEAAVANAIDPGQEHPFQTSEMFICENQQPAEGIQLADFTGVAVGRSNTVSNLE